MNYFQVLLSNFKLRRYSAVNEILAHFDGKHAARPPPDVARHVIQHIVDPRFLSQLERPHPGGARACQMLPTSATSYSTLFSPASRDK